MRNSSSIWTPSLTPSSPNLVGFALPWRLLLFLVIWPGINFLALVLMLHSFDKLNATLASFIALKLWSVFAVFLLLLLGFEKLCRTCITRGHFWLTIGSHLIAALLAVSLVHFLFNVVRENPAPPLRYILILVLILETVLYVTAIYLVMQRDKSLALMVNLQQLESEVLRARSNPHFLFNTLNLIAYEAKADPERCQALIYDLADLMRRTVDMSSLTLVTVEQELAIVSLYLQLQQRRFEDRLSFTIDCDDNCKQLTLPPLLLQPVIENAITHGIATQAVSGQINVRVYQTQKTLHIDIRDSGKQFSAEHVTHGAGLSILQKTLQSYYSDNHFFILKSTPSGTQVSITLPAQPLKNLATTMKKGLTPWHNG